MSEELWADLVLEKWRPREDTMVNNGFEEEMPYAMPIYVRAVATRGVRVRRPVPSLKEGGHRGESVTQIGESCTHVLDNAASKEWCTLSRAKVL